MKRGSSNVPKSKLDQIKSGAVTKKQIGNVNENKKVFHGKGGKFAITETEKKFEESGVTRKKRNYVMYESKLGTEKEQDLKKIQAAPKPRREEQIVQTRKKVEYLDNYQYHETKDIKDNDPNKVSIVTHRRLGDIVGGSYEVSTFQRNTFIDSGKGAKLYSSQTTKTTTRKNAPQPAQPAKTVKKTETTTKTSRTLPAQSRDYRKEVKKTTTTTNLKTVPKKPAAAPLTQAPSRRTKPSANPAKPTTTTTKTTKTTTTRTRTQSAGTGRRY